MTPKCYSVWRVTIFAKQSWLSSKALRLVHQKKFFLASFKLIRRVRDINKYLKIYKISPISLLLSGHCFHIIKLWVLIHTNQSDKLDEATRISNFLFHWKCNINFLIEGSVKVLFFTHSTEYCEFSYECHFFTDEKKERIANIVEG